MRFKVDENQGVMRHTVERTTTSRSEPIRHSFDVEIAVGSGQQGRSYLTVEDGALFQSPISWYKLADKWALSPGFECLAAVVGLLPSDVQYAILAISNWYTDRKHLSALANETANEHRL